MFTFGIIGNQVQPFGTTMVAGDKTLETATFQGYGAGMFGSLSSQPLSGFSMYGLASATGVETDFTFLQFEGDATAALSGGALFVGLVGSEPTGYLLSAATFPPSFDGTYTSVQWDSPDARPIFDSGLSYTIYILS